MQNCLGLYEYETHAAIRRLSHGCRSFLDLGAAKGELSIYFLRLPDVERVVAVEPSASERDLFASNLSLNGLKDDARLRIHPGFAGDGVAPQWQTLDKLANGLPSPVFIKMDIDGPEAEVLGTGLETLAGKDCRVLIETHSAEAESKCIERLHFFGYLTKIIKPAWWRVLLPERRTISHNQWLIGWRGHHSN
ncbi:MAG TPA: FkbM family methyltransferase [Opitutales bacterium]|nr:FkbM family methyltransferase [Opitutales bacterium]